MENLKIRVYKDGRSEPDTSIRIPINILKIAYKVLPKQAESALREKGIDISEIVRIAENPEIEGNIIEIEEHRKNEKIIISLE